MSILLGVAVAVTTAIACLIAYVWWRRSTLLRPAVEADNTKLPIGTRVQVNGLTGKVEMNGHAGRIEKEFDDVNQRYTVRLELLKQVLLVRPANLRRLEEEQEDRSHRDESVKDAAGDSDNAAHAHSE